MVSYLDCSEAWFNLREDDQKYVYHIYRASWYGARINLQQTSVESLTIFEILQNIFVSCGSPDNFYKCCAKNKIDDWSIIQFFEYATQIYGNLGNYTSYGDQKIIPQLSEDEFENIVKTIAPSSLNKFNQIKNLIYSKEPSNLGYGNTTYLSNNVTKEDTDLIQRFLDTHNISGVNTQLTKFDNTNKSYAIYISSLNEKKFQFEECQVIVQYGKFGYELKNMADELRKAIPYANNQLQRNMLEKIIESYITGDINAHKEAQVNWIKDKNPSIEVIHGFIETYRDPAGVRGEYEGVVSVVNKIQSIKYQRLTMNVSEIIKTLPWSSEFERDSFIIPNFTSVDAFAFVTSGVYLGVNLPNYNDVCQTIGHKNLLFNNIVKVQAKNQVRFLPVDYHNLIKKYSSTALEIVIALHELIGHGTIKLLGPEALSVINPLTDKHIDTYYTEGQTYYSVFGDISNDYEECRAESIALFLCSEPNILEIFECSISDYKKIILTNWIMMLHEGLCGLEQYNPLTGQWMQSHSRARFGILRTLLEQAPELVSISIDNHNKSLMITIDETKIETVGRDIMRKLILQQSIYKATANIIEGRKLFENITKVDGIYLKYHDLVMLKKQTRCVWVQPNLVLDNNKISLKEYYDNQFGLIQSFIDRADLVS